MKITALYFTIRTPHQGLKLGKHDHRKERVKHGFPLLNSDSHPRPGASSLVEPAVPGQFLSSSLLLLHLAGVRGALPAEGVRSVGRLPTRQCRGEISTKFFGSQVGCLSSGSQPHRNALTSADISCSRPRGQSSMRLLEDCITDVQRSGTAKRCLHHNWLRVIEVPIHKGARRRGGRSR